MRYTTPEEDEATFARMETFSREAENIDVTLFSPRMRQVIQAYEQTVTAHRLANETDMQRLKRSMPNTGDCECVGYLLASSLRKALS